MWGTYVEGRIADVERHNAKNGDPRAVEAQIKMMLRTVLREREEEHEDQNESIAPPVTLGE